MDDRRIDADAGDAARAVADLADRLRVTADGTDRFVGRVCEVGSPAVYGGQFVGQAVMAAGLTAPDRPVHSLHASFIRPGSKAAPVDYRVERTFDGTSFCRRRVTAWQHERLLFEADVSLQRIESGGEHQLEMPAAPAPEHLRNERSLRAERTDAPQPSLWPIDVRPATGDESARENRWWVRAAAALDDDPLLHQAMLAYASDYKLLQSVLRTHGLRFMQPGLHLASLDHALWFHRAARTDAWLLFSATTPNASGARAFVRGEVFDAGGRLVASIAQETLMRVSGARRDAAARSDSG